MMFGGLLAGIDLAGLVAGLSLPKHRPVYRWDWTYSQWMRVYDAIEVAGRAMPLFNPRFR
jgi:hypothetical protein